MKEYPTTVSGATPAVRDDISPKHIDVGLYEGLDAATYHALPYCSNSKLTHLKRSASHLKTALAGEFNLKSEAIRKGSALDVLLLEPIEWPNWTVFPENFSRGRTDGKLAWAKAANRFGEAHLERHHLRHAEYLDVLAMKNAVLSNTDAREFIEAGGERMNQISIVFRWLDVLFKGRLDRLLFRPSSSIAIDLKTTRDASPEGFSKIILDRGYHRQAAIYMTGCAILGRPVEAFVIVAVENSAPYNCSVYELSSDFLMLGLAEVKALAKRYKFCVEKDYWPGYTTGVEVIEPPKWARFDVDFEEKYLSDLPKQLKAA